MVRNPMNVHQVSRISLKRDVVDCIVFWTKNPQEMIPRLHVIDDYPYYFQFTLNPYDVQLEMKVPRKTAVIEVFKKLSDRLGPQRVIWRYDPILITDRIDAGYHEKYFEVLAAELCKYTAKCIISFVDFYKKVGGRLRDAHVVEISDLHKRDIAAKLATIAKSHGLRIETCAEDVELAELGIEHGRCIDPTLIESLLGVGIRVEKDKSQRKPCGCVTSVDIGSYNTCRHGCVYCYANFSGETTKRNIAGYERDSPLLCSTLRPEDAVVDRECRSCVMAQMALMD